MADNSAVEEIEKARKKVRFLDRLLTLLVVYMFFIPVIDMVVFKKTVIDGRSVESLLLFAQYVGGLICMLVIIGASNREINKIKKLYKKGFVKEVLSQRLPGATYRWTRGFLESQVKNFGITRMDNVFRSEDYLKAEYKGIRYEQADVLIEHQFPSHRAMNSTIFKGRMFRFRGLPARISYISIYSRNYKQRGGIKIWKDPETGQKIRQGNFSCKDKDFDSKFEVYAVKEQELLALMTPEFMKLLQNMLERYSSLAFQFEEDNLYVALNTSRDTFDLEMVRRVDLQKERERIHEDIQDIESIVDVLVH